MVLFRKEKLKIAVLQREAPVHVRIGEELMKQYRKMTAAVAALSVLAGSLTGCGGTSDTISVITREDGSGTRGAFTEICGIEEDGRRDCPQRGAPQQLEHHSSAFHLPDSIGVGGGRGV